MHFVWFSLRVHSSSCIALPFPHFAASIFRRKSLRSSNFGGKHPIHIRNDSKQVQCRAKSPFIFFPISHFGRFFPPLTQFIHSFVFLSSFWLGSFVFKMCACFNIFCYEIASAGCKHGRLWIRSIDRVSFACIASHTHRHSLLFLVCSFYYIVIFIMYNVWLLLPSFGAYKNAGKHLAPFRFWRTKHEYYQGIGGCIGAYWGSIRHALVDINFLLKYMPNRRTLSLTREDGTNDGWNGSMCH